MQTRLKIQCGQPRSWMQILQQTRNRARVRTSNSIQHKLEQPAGLWWELANTTQDQQRQNESFIDTREHLQGLSYQVSEFRVLEHLTTMIAAFGSVTHIVLASLHPA